MNSETILTLPDMQKISVKNPVGKHELVYYTWGNPDAERVIFCLHGLTRNGRDFDFFAQDFKEQAYVIAPDLAGRGKSAWLTDPGLYTIEQYISDLHALLVHLNIQKLDWVGTSLGGLIGMGMAAQYPNLVERLVLNDIGPFIHQAAIFELGGQLKSQFQFQSLKELLDYLKRAYGHSGAMQEHHWEHMAVHDHRHDESGHYTRAYDPNIFRSLSAYQATDIDVWNVFEQLKCPILVLHGMDSHILTSEICQQMRQRHTQTEVIDLPGVGHAPSLMVEEHIQLIKNWLLPLKSKV